MVDRRLSEDLDGLGNIGQYGNYAIQEWLLSKYCQGFNGFDAKGIKSMKNYLASEIPGMIEPVEQIMLENLAKVMSFVPGECVVEFGTFFGRSTACISAGLEENSSFTDECGFYAYDSFECDKEGGFYPHVASFAKKAGVENLLEITGRKVNFLPVFEHYLSAHINSGILHPQKTELNDSFHKSGKIKILHIDSPKFYKEFKVVLFRFFPHLKEGSVVIFQDFFYHWSASVIAACGLMMKEGLLRPEISAASSLVFSVNKKFDADKITEIDLQMERGNIPELIDCAKNFVEKIDLDRIEYFKPRLVLAKIQWLFENGNHSLASEELVKFFNSGGKLNKSIASDFIELMKNGFSMRHLYEKDHQA
jgi:Methyltransferase domain